MSRRGSGNLRVKLAYSRARLAAELRDKTCILHRHGLVESGPDRDTILIHNDDADDTLMRLQALQGLLYLACLARHGSTADGGLWVADLNPFRV